jgi:hypothetical protein
MSKPICPKKALAEWKKTAIGQSSVNFGSLDNGGRLRARIHLAFMAGFDAGAKAEHKRQLRAKSVKRKTKV